MNIHYCDFCSQPLSTKCNYVAVFKEVPLNIPNQVPKNHTTYEVCPDCYALILKIFDLRKEKIKELCEMIEKMWAVPEKKKKNG